MNSQNVHAKSPLETLYVNSKKVICQGKNQSEGNSGQSLGHPTIYLDMGDDNSVTCPYCSKCFIYKQPN